jgi:uncharacterized protein DUF6941
MEATLILCDYAQVNGGKLYVVGAGINLLVTPTVSPPYPINVWLGALVTVPWSAHNLPHSLKIYVTTEDGATVPITQPADANAGTRDEGGFLAEFNAGRAPHMTPGESSLMPLAVPLHAPHPNIGGYVATLEIDGKKLVNAHYRLMAPQPFGSPLG